MTDKCHRLINSRPTIGRFEWWTAEEIIQVQKLYLSGMGIQLKRYSFIWRSFESAILVEKFLTLMMHKMFSFRLLNFISRDNSTNRIARARYVGKKVFAHFAKTVTKQSRGEMQKDRQREKLRIGESKSRKVSALHFGGLKRVRDFGGRKIFWFLNVKRLLVDGNANNLPCRLNIAGFNTRSNICKIYRPKPMAFSMEPLSLSALWLHLNIKYFWVRLKSCSNVQTRKV